MPDSYQRLQIAARAIVDPRTVVRCYQGKRVRPGVAARVCAAARELHIPEPVPLIAD
jgi:hypothetical protein